MAQGTKQGQSQGLWCFSQGKGGLKRDVQVPRSVPSPAPWAVSGQVLRGSVWEEGTCMFPCPGDRRRDQPELGHTGRVLAILQTRSPCPSGWRHRGLTPRIAVNARGELQRDPGSCKARAGPCKQGLPRAGLGSRREKPTEGRSGWPLGAEKMLHEEKYSSSSSPRTAPLSQQSRDRFRGKDRFASSTATALYF